MGLRFRVDDEILSRYHGVKIGVLVGRGVRVEGQNPLIEELKGRAVGEAADAVGSGAVTAHPFIASWREMYRSFGTRPGDYRPSAEALLRRALKEGALPLINTAVDAYNIVSIRHLIPMGGFDLDSVQGAITLRLSGGGEAFLPLGASRPEETYRGEPVYADGARVLTRRWNHRDCEETKITVETANVAMFADGSPEIPRESVETAINDLRSLLMSCSRGEFASAMADVDSREVSL